jgi:hypothetical protein
MDVAALVPNTVKYREASARGAAVASDTKLPE